MIRKGGIAEVKKISKIKVPTSNSSIKIIGVNEIKNLLNKHQNTEQTIEHIIIKTRQYAKRQATWAKGQMKDWKFISPSDTKLPIKKLLN